MRPFGEVPSLMAGKVAAILDRDGVIVEEVGHLTEPSHLSLIPESAEAIARLNRSSATVIVATNQSAVARGLLTEEQVDAIHVALNTMLSEAGAHIDGYYYCPHHPTEGIGAFRIECQCRKPKPDMLRRAAAEHAIDLTASVMIGDKLSDLEAGASAGCTTILVRTGYGIEFERELADSGLNSTIVADDLSEAVDIFLSSQGA